MDVNSMPPSDPVAQPQRFHHQETTADFDLLRRLRTQDEHALEALYDRYSGLIFTLALRIVGDRDLAQEVLQDTFLRCWNGAAQYDESRGRVAAWLMGIARNRAIDLLRSRQHQTRLREQDMPESAQGDSERTLYLTQHDPSDALLLQRAVRDALANLSDAQRQVIELAYYGGLTQIEIADKLSAPVGTVKARMRDGLERLRHTLRSLIEPERMSD